MFTFHAKLPNPKPEHFIFLVKAVKLIMSTENLNGQDDVQDVQDKKQKKHDSGAADLERVTDFMEESEISNDFISNVNSQKLFAEIKSHQVSVSFRQ